MHDDIIPLDVKNHPGRDPNHDPPPVTYHTSQKKSGPRTINPVADQLTSRQTTTPERPDSGRAPATSTPRPLIQLTSRRNDGKQRQHTTLEKPNERQGDRDTRTVKKDRSHGTPAEHAHEPLSGAAHLAQDRQSTVISLIFRRCRRRQGRSLPGAEYCRRLDEILGYLPVSILANNN